MKNIKFGFTLSELLITVGIIGTMLLILTPVLRNAIPNQPLVMFKKAYFITERTISELVNDDGLYPENFDNAAKDFLANTVEVKYNGKTFSGSSKFCGLFAEKLNLKTIVSCSSAVTFTNGTASAGNFKTSDNIVYSMPITDFASATDAYEIHIDTNDSKAPNCFYNASSCIAPDRFKIKVYQNGRVAVDGVREIQYLGATNTSKRAEEFDD